VKVFRQKKGELFVQRNNKICKIVEEMSLFLMDNGYYDISIDIKREDIESIITFTTDILDEEVSEYIIEKLSEPREEEVEEYSWMLMGEGSSADDLDIIGNLVDSVNITNLNEKSIIKVIRDEEY
jgi:hypothetical protein